MIIGNGNYPYVLPLLSADDVGSNADVEPEAVQVSFVTLANTAHTGISCWAVYEHLIEEFGGIESLEKGSWCVSTSRLVISKLTDLSYRVAGLSQLILDSSFRSDSCVPSTPYRLIMYPR